MPLSSSAASLPRRLLRAGALLASVSAGHVSAAEPATAWQVTPRYEHSQVEINGNDARWDAWSVAVDRSAPAGGVRAELGRQARDGAADDELRLSAYGRAGDWSADATVQLSPDPHFLPEWGYAVDVERAAGRNRRAGAGYRRLQFADSSVDLWSTHMTFYRGDDEFGLEYRFGRNDALDHDIRVLQARAGLIRGANRYAVYLARGDYLFDALGIPGGRGDGWSATLALARAITPSTTLRWELGAGGEADTFRQRTIAMSVQYRP